jgi:hypothetical protein
MAITAWALGMAPVLIGVRIGSAQAGDLASGGAVRLL